MNEERKLIEKDFSKEEIECAEQIFPNSPNYSEVNGVKLGNHLLENIGFTWPKHKLVYNLSAPMQCGKTRTTLSAILRLIKSEQYKNDNLYLIWYISAADNGLLDKTRDDLVKFFAKTCKGQGELKKDDTAIKLYRNNRSIEIRIIHNQTSQIVKDEIVRHFRHFSQKSSIMKILVFDESDQAIANNSQKHAFLTSLINEKYPYSPEAMSKRLSCKMLELNVSATNFTNIAASNQMIASKAFENYKAQTHPWYNGVDELSDLGCLKPNDDLDFSDVVFDYANNSELEDQFNRPFALVRIPKGKQNNKEFYQNNIEGSTPNSIFVSSYEELLRSMQTPEPKVFCLFANNGKNFTRGAMEDLFDDFRNAQMGNEMALSKIPHILNKKFIFIICGILKAGDDLLNKNRDQIAFQWETPPANMKTCESPLQQAGRICGIASSPDEIFPLLYTSRKIIGIMTDFYKKEVMPQHHRFNSSNKKNRFNKAFVKISDSTWNSWEEARSASIKFRSKLKCRSTQTTRCIYGDFKQPQGEGYRQRVKHIQKFYKDNRKDLLGGKSNDFNQFGQVGGEACYVLEKEPGKFEFILHLLYEKDQTIPKQLVDIAMNDSNAYLGHKALPANRVKTDRTIFAAAAK